MSNLGTIDVFIGKYNIESFVTYAHGISICLGVQIRSCISKSNAMDTLPAEIPTTSAGIVNVNSSPDDLSLVNFLLAIGVSPQYTVINERVKSKFSLYLNFNEIFPAEDNI